jgi:iron complex outermembrane receptor protein
VWANGGGQRSGDYKSPLGIVENSFSREGSAAAGFGYYLKKSFFSVNYNFNQRRYGIPFEPSDPDAE